MASVFTIGGERWIERGLIPQDEWEKIKREVAQAQHEEIMAHAAKADEDPQVGWDYSKNWRRAPLPQGKVFGSDYDYWNYVVDDAFALWDQHAGQIKHDYIAERIAKEPQGWSVDFYAAGFGVWQNGKPVTRGQRLEGPRVDVGPTADFSAFLERWNYSKTHNAGEVAIYWDIGVMNFIARQLQLAYKGIHTVFMMPIKPNSMSEVRETRNRRKPVRTLPIIRITPRFYRKT